MVNPKANYLPSTAAAEFRFCFVFPLRSELKLLLGVFIMQYANDEKTEIKI